MREALCKLGGTGRVISWLPLATLMRCATWLSKDTQDMWRVHGPKISAQTRLQLQALVERAGGDGLKELQKRLG
jgi:hypothetical protein